MTWTEVDASARLHLGLIDLRGDLNRRFGGVGMALAEPRVRLRVARREAGDDRAEGPDAERALRFARRFLDHHGLGDVSVTIEIGEAIPAHVGLGSGTQLALAVARGLAGLFDLEADATELARAVGRTARSAVGTWLFERGGFVLEGGRKPSRPAAAPILFHRPLPDEWRCVIAIPRVERGMSGEAEKEAFQRMAPPSTEKVGAISHLILMGVLPALTEGDLPAFGAAVTELQEHVGDCFRDLQGGRFAHAEVARVIAALREAGAHGAGQSSWGPAAFGLAGDEGQARELLAVARQTMSDAGRGFIAGFDNRGARCRVAGERADASVPRGERGGRTL